MPLVKYSFAKTSFDPEYFFFDLPLYERIELNADNKQGLLELMWSKKQFEGYHPDKDENTTYQISHDISAHDSLAIMERLSYYERTFQIDATCKRDGFEISVLCQVYEKKVDGKSAGYWFMKWGQSPSLADLQIGKVKTLAKALDKKYQPEFTKAIGLFAHGIGIGAFVYLRRIFEFLVYEVKDEYAKSISGWDEGAFGAARMPEKIDMLKSHLPPFLVKSKGIYGILSKGIHELEEDECKEYFPAVKQGISIILAQRIRQKEELKEQKEAELVLSTIQSKLSGKP